MVRPSDPSFEERLISEIAEIDRQLAELQAEKEALTRQLLKARAQHPTLKDVSRLNSGQRVMAEQAILELLGRQNEAFTLKKILSHVRKNAVHELKDNTLRTYLHRLKERGLVANPRRGVWALAPTNSND